MVQYERDKMTITSPDGWFTIETNDPGNDHTTLTIRDNLAGAQITAILAPHDTGELYRMLSRRPGAEPGQCRAEHVDNTHPTGTPIIYRCEHDAGHAEPLHEDGDMGWTA